jgi:hypothetical protein
MVMFQFVDSPSAGLRSPALRDCLAAVSRHFDRGLVTPAAERAIDDCVTRLPFCGVLVFEHRLHDRQAQVDVSVRIPRAAISLSPAARAARAWLEAERLSRLMLVPAHHIAAIDLEFDLPVADLPVDGGGELSPRVFLQTTRDTPADHLLPLARLLLGAEPRAEQRAVLERCQAALSGQERVLHVYAQFGEDTPDVLRMVVTGLTVDRLPAYLRAIAWPGDVDDLAAWLAELAPLADNVDLAFSVDDEVQAKLGLEFFIAPRDERRAEWERLFAPLCARGLCLPERAHAVLDWWGPVEHGVGERWTITRFRSHLKLSHDGARACGLKAYVGAHTRGNP